MERGHFQYILILLTIVNIYFGFFRRSNVNSDGYNLCQFIYLYYIGRYIKSISLSLDSNKRVLYLSGYVVSSLLIFSLAFIRMKTGCPWVILGVSYYCHPLVIIAAVFLFLYFRTLDISSRIINFMAGSALSIYLIHENSYVSSNIYLFFNRITSQLSGSACVVAVILGTSLIFLSCIFIDQVRKIVIYPIYNSLYPLISTLDRRINTICKDGTNNNNNQSE